MRVSLKWLADYVDLTLPPEEIAHRLTMAGSEVSGIERIGAGWRDIFVGRVVELAPHPNADRLQLVTVDYGRGTTTVVAGAFNIKVGDKVPLALEGAKVVDAHRPEGGIVTVKATKLRGVVSQGMACSPKELGLSDDHSGIMVLDLEAELGRPLQDELGDVILEIDTAANRPDLLSIIGIAREVAALTGQHLRIPPIEFPEDGPPADSRIAIEIADPDLCSRYSATYLEGVKIGPSPKWLRERIAAAGMRPINNIVDITNFVMLEWGQPLHAFDYDLLRGRRIIVRRARPGERMTTLDGVERVLNPDMLVIADAEHPVAIAGVMGGADSEVGDGTTNILLESANFNPVSIRRTSRGLRLPSEASRRFEKGLPPEQTDEAARRATRLMRELAGGTAGKGVADCYPRPRQAWDVLLTTAELKRVLGIDMEAERIAATLARLGFGTTVDGDNVIARVPAFRGDVMLPADLTEEVARLIGYGEIPTTTMSGPLPPRSENESRRREELVREVLVGAGFAEVICYSLTSEERLARLAPAGSLEEGPAAAVKGTPQERQLAKDVDQLLAWTAWPPLALVNPLSEDFDCLRTTAFGSLLEALRDNLRHEVRDVMLFEIGRLYVPRAGDLPEERRVLTIATGALQSARPWGAEREVEFFDLKGVAELLLDRLGRIGASYVPLAHPMFQPGRAAAILFGSAETQELAGVVGEVNPRVRASFDVDGRAYLLGFDLDRLVQRAPTQLSYQPLLRYPAVRQDLAVIVSEQVPAAVIRNIIVETGAPLVREVELFDVYRGAPIPAGTRSLAYRMLFQSGERTLTDEEVNGIRERIVDALTAEVGATLRG